MPSITSSVPDLVILSSSGGAARHLQIVNWCYESNIPVFSSFTEGMFREKDIEGFLWGWNKEREFKENLRMMWSIPSYKMAIKKYPDLKEKLCVSGATGFDKYQLIRNYSCYAGSYKKVIGYAAFDYYSCFHHRKKILEDALGPEYIQFLSDELKIIKTILKNIILENDDILFLIKSHPGDQGRIPMEVEDIHGYPNVKVVRSPREPIANIVSSSDIWLCGNSTTVIDAWLHGKPTIAMISAETEKTTQALDASILSQNKNKINEYINEYYDKGFISDFDQLNGKRQHFLNCSIGSSDGMNHVRYMSFLKQYIENIENNLIEKGKWNIPTRERLTESVKHLIYIISKGRYNFPYLNKWAHIYDRFKVTDLQTFWHNHGHSINDYYVKNCNEIDYIYVNHKSIFEDEIKFSDG